ncbi:MAG: hypothetical protein HQ538_05695 [Parcubacteria group bacterium]|nr:hypothetical protein [Parcubacteria group bacterium]
MQNEQPKNKHFLKHISIIVGFVIIITLLITEGILGWSLINNVKDEQSDIKNSQEEINNKYSDLENSINEIKNNQTDYKNRLIKLEVKNNNENLEEDESVEIIESENSTEEESNSANCDFSKDTTLRSTDNYDIFGESEFDTVVCGYVKTQKEIVFGEEQENIYFVITNYKDSKFRESIVEGIKNGNTVNKKIGDYYALNLGCKNGDKISGMQYKSDETYIDDTTQSSILSSTTENPLSLTVSFDKHEGVGCTCCNLASKVRLY